MGLQSAQANSLEESFCEFSGYADHSFASAESLKHSVNEGAE